MLNWLMKSLPQTDWLFNNGGCDDKASLPPTQIRRAHLQAPTYRI